MSYSGLRTIEILRLRRGDVDMDRRTINVKGKGKHTYELVKLIGMSVEDVGEYLAQVVDSFPSRTSPLYPTLKDELQVQRMTKKLLTAAGLAQEKLSAHSLRHTAAQILIDQDVNPVYVQQQLRHSSFEVTQFYVRKTMKKKFLKEVE